MECELYGSHKETLATFLQRTCGMPSLDIHTLLGTEEHPINDHWRSTIHSVLGNYITATKRFDDQASVENPGGEPISHQTHPFRGKDLNT